MTMYLIYRLAVIATMTGLMILWLMDAINDDIQGLVKMLIFWSGAWFWESVLFMYKRWSKTA